MLRKVLHHTFIRWQLVFQLGRCLKNVRQDKQKAQQLQKRLLDFLTRNVYYIEFKMDTKSDNCKNVRLSNFKLLHVFYCDLSVVYVPNSIILSNV